MVYVNSKKFACESCIKGHRSSSCHHTDRPLFEIKKKGRPVSQCEKCRELRQSKKVHSKCTCNPRTDPASRGQVLASTTSKSRRFIPIVPALPNGLRDVLAASQVRTSLPANARQRGIFAIYTAALKFIASLIFDLVDSLLNPCNCRSVWKCNCRQAQLSPSATGSTGDLATLAHVAATHCPDTSIASPSSSALKPLDRTAKIALPRTNSLAPSSASTSNKRHTSHPPSPQLESHKRSKHHHHSHSHHDHRPSPVFELPPIQSSPQSTPPLVNRVPDFAFMPPISTITSLAGSGCTCGVQCACPGCVVHRGSEYAAKDLHDCADGQCRTCIDNQAGVALPESTSPFSSTPAASSSNSGSLPSLDYITKSVSLNRFFKRAAALPPPPPRRRLGTGIQIDPRDIGHGAPSNSTPINLPKLECCGGRCTCPSDRCGCGTSCGGCCADMDSPMSSNEVQLTSGHAVAPLGGCCAGAPP
ncbi:hypothetical protein P691DRAFT_4125 [Macrolepiota fuliginosa MF-IS2]|uniref:Copper-fist domain-containing protein n=1 Tax=Macrolepiota fuliginosa MF-IS2 TaxID=1400762 RepID=A0A9P5XT43_9AGAR|nr:hypothetical protein P691DRAFT_4125 [Macrolepiota fuliginosa MF-IS2]